MALSAVRVQSLKEPGRYTDGTAGLQLYVSKSGSRAWVQRITIAGRRRDIGLGGYPAVSLAKARKKALANSEVVADGGDPLAAKHQVKAKKPTFREAAQTVHKLNLPRWRNAKTASNWLQTLERHAMPYLGNMPVDEIGREDVLRVLTPIWTSRPETARRVRQRIRATLRWAQAHGHVEVNNAGEAIDGALPKLPAVKEHYRSLPYQDVASALRIVDATKASMAARLCLRFLVLTTTRSGESRGARWDEVNLDAKTWTIPLHRMKTHAEHRVPLSRQALKVLRQAETLRDDSGLVFPSPMKPGAMSDMTLTKLLRTTGLAASTTVHGFRSSFKGWCMEAGASWEASETALAHTLGDQTVQAYARSDMFERRRTLMQTWGDFVEAS